MVRLCKDRDSEMDTVLAIPEDVSYVSAGLILSSVSSGTGPLQDYFGSTGSFYLATDVAIVLLINCVVSIVVHKISHSLTKKQYMTWRAAVQEQENRPPIGGPQMELALQGSASAAYDDNLSAAI